MDHFIKVLALVPVLRAETIPVEDTMVSAESPTENRYAPQINYGVGASRYNDLVCRPAAKCAIHVRYNKS